MEREIKISNDLNEISVLASFIEKKKAVADNPLV